MEPPATASLTCISNFPIATYSGMLPGVLTGQYDADQMQIDLVRLCASAGVRLICDEVTGVDVGNREIHFATRPSIRFDALSIGIGSVPSGLIDSSTIVAIKPMQTFLHRLRRQLLSCIRKSKKRPVRIAVVGAGAAGVEVCCCLPNFVQQVAHEQNFSLTLITQSDDIIPDAAVGTRRRIKKLLADRSVDILLDRRVKNVDEDSVQFQNHPDQPADLVIWATSATAPPLLSTIELPKDERGFLRTDATLRTIAGEPIFAVGDSGTIDNTPTAKAGVYAVRQGPILYDNLLRTIDERALVPYRPQSRFLKLLNLGDGRAVAEHFSLSMAGRVAWRWKDWIDRRFMAMYQDYQPAMFSSMQAEREDDGDLAQMRCAGCGGKVAASVLSRVLKRLDIPTHSRIEIGLDQPDDVAVLRTESEHPTVLTTDQFAAPLSDPYLVGRIGMLNALSDLYATGVEPVAALANIILPHARPEIQEQCLYEVLSGAVEELAAADATLAGGHTIEGPTLTVGFTIVGDPQSRKLQTKRQLRVGDQLLLTKPIGSGVLLAAHMRAMCRATWYDELVRQMLVSNRIALSLLDEFDIHGMTDVTGFGLANHLVEMLMASQMSAKLSLSDIPLLDGVAELIGQRIESTLAPANRQVETTLSVTGSMIGRAEYSALFDPQTCGGLLLGAPRNMAAAALDYIRQIQGEGAAIVGEVIVASSDGPRLHVE